MLDKTENSAEYLVYKIVSYIVLMIFATIDY